MSGSIIALSCSEQPGSHQEKQGSLRLIVFPAYKTMSRRWVKHYLW